jgi:tRNA pseudouridine synthase 10
MIIEQLYLSATIYGDEVQQMTEQPVHETLELASRMLETTPLCDQCLGRQFAWLSTETTNRNRGESIKLVLSMIADEKMKAGDLESGTWLISILAANGMYPPAQKLVEKYGLDYEPVEKCALCTISGISVFDRIPELSKRVTELLQDYEFDFFLVGCIPSSELSDLEDELRAQYGLLHGEPLKSDFNRELGKSLQKSLQKDVEFEYPDIVIIYDMKKDSIKFQINPLFIYGRYRKLKRGIPQSRWDCGECKGKGCEICGGTGRKYPDSISEYIGSPIIKAMRGTRFKFHAAGREDIDVLMLGDGRPFVVEISEPRIRNFDLTKLSEQINQHAEGKIEVLNLEFSERSRAQNLKEEASENIKEYVALIETQEMPSDEILRLIESKLTGIEINQRTPNRVAHRRSDLVRKKSIHEVRLKKKDDRLLEAYFKVQGGTYVKEFISGDGGRTVPSLSEKLGIACSCVKLDVVAVHSANRP